MIDDTNDIVAVLREVPLFADFRADELADLATRCLTRRYRKGETLWEVGDPAEELLIAGAHHFAVGGPLPLVRETQSHLNRADAPAAAVVDGARREGAATPT